MRPDAPPAREFVPFMGRPFRLDGAAVEDMNPPIALGNTDGGLGASPNCHTDVVTLDAHAESVLNELIGPDESRTVTFEASHTAVGIGLSVEHSSTLDGWATMCALWSTKLERSEFSAVVHAQLECLREDCKMASGLFQTLREHFEPESQEMMANLGDRYKQMKQRMETMFARLDSHRSLKRQRTV